MQVGSFLIMVSERFINLGNFYHTINVLYMFTS